MMDPIEKAAFIQTQAACAVIEALGMAADNQHRLSLGYSIAYDGDAFSGLISKYLIGHNDVIGYLMGGR